MTTKIDSLDISLFKGFKETSVKFNPGLNLLVGDNNSGKSSLLQAVYLAFDFLRLTNGISEVDKNKKGKPLHGANIKNLTLPFHDESYISEGLKKRSRRENATTIKIKTLEGLQFMETATFPGSNLLIISSDIYRSGGTLKYQESIKKLIKDNKKLPLLIPTFSGVSTREQMQVPAVVKYYITTGKSSEVLRNQLKEFSKQQLTKLNSYLTSSFGVVITSTDPKEINLSSYTADSEYKNLDISSAGSGFQQILQILVYIVSSNSDTILIDEPDAHLHYKLQNTLYDILLEIVKDGKQIIVSTHSQIFIKRALQNNDHLLLVDKKQIQQKSIQEYTEGLSKLYEKGLIDEHEITQGGELKLIAFEDSVDGHGSGILQQFFSKIDVREPEYKFDSNNGSSNSIIPYVARKEKIENVTLKAIEFRDSDSLSETFIEKIISHEEHKNVSILYFSVHEIENFLIDASVISRILIKIGINTDEEKIKKLIESTVKNNKDSLIDDLERALEGKYKQHFRIFGTDYNYMSTFVRDRRNEIKQNFLQYPYSLLPGKELFKLIKQKIHSEYHFSISEIDVAKEFKKSEIPQEIKNAIKFFGE